MRWAQISSNNSVSPGDNLSRHVESHELVGKINVVAPMNIKLRIARDYVHEQHKKHDFDRKYNGCFS